MRAVRVGDVLELRRGPIEIDSVAEYVAIGIRSFGKGIFHYPPTPGAELSKLRFFDIHPDELILSNIKAWEAAIAVSSPHEIGCVGSNRFLSYQPVGDAIDARYACYFFLSERGLPLIQRASPGSADRNRTLAIERFENLEIPLPDLAEQRRIVGRLSAILDRVDSVEALGRRSAELANAVPVALAQRPDVSAEERRSLGWREVQLGELMRVDLDEVAVEPDRSYPNVGVLSFGRGLFEKPPIDGASTSATRLYRIRGGQLLYSRLFAFEGAYAHVEPRFDGFFVSNEFPAFTIDEGRADVGFLAAYLRSPAVWSELAKSSKGLGLRRQRVHPETLLAWRAWLPPLREQRRIGLIAQRVAGVAGSRRFADSRVAALRMSALNAAFSGVL